MPSSLRKPPRRRGQTAVVRHTRLLAGWIYTNNPFYAISAVLVLWGLWASFDTGRGAVEAAKLMTGLGGYVVLLSAAACFLIRFGALWEDVRTILLVIVLMLLAISMTPDQALAFERADASVTLLCGLAFAVVISEALLWALRLKLPLWFRVPYHLLLVLFFLYPLGLSPLLDDPDDPLLYWGLFGFATFGAAVLLTLIPAIRRGPGYVQRSGSPWRWPWRPWTLFGLLAVGLGVRAYCLCVSFHPVKGDDTIFGFYFLAPLLLAAVVLLMEIGLASRLSGVMRAALLAPVFVLAVAATAPLTSGSDLGFLDLFTATLGGYPLFFTLMAVLVFYAVAVLRRLPDATEALSAAAAMFVVCGPGTIDLDTLVGPRGVPLILIGLLQLALALKCRSAVRSLNGSACLLAGTSIESHAAYLAARRALAGFDQLLAGLLFFLLAVLISLTKMGLPQRWYARFQKGN